jgi:2-(1,2-epoxy-1,2-dihydrophenyl)acetyl-CoA isomerase
MKTKPLVSLKWQDDIAIISLNRPARHNALVPELLSDLLAVLGQESCQHSAVVILRAEGRSFSTGGDLAAFHDQRENIGQYADEIVGLLNQVIMTVYTHPAPVVCAVNGQVTGGSLGLLLASDRVIMRRGQTITPYYAVVGFSPDGGWTALLPDIIGRAQTMDWLARNASHDADTCLALGLVQEVVETDAESAALIWADRITKMKSGSIIKTRRLLNCAAEDLRLRLEAERISFVEQIQTPQALTGLEQFLRRQKHD